MKVSLCDLCSPASSTRRMIFETVLSPKLLVVRTRSTPDKLTQPDTTSSSVSTLRGIVSPVSATVFNWLLPSTTTPSKGTFSPTRMRIISPTATSSGATSLTSNLSPLTSNLSPLTSTCATSGRISIRWAILSRLFPSA